MRPTGATGASIDAPAVDDQQGDRRRVAKGQEWKSDGLPRDAEEPSERRRQVRPVLNAQAPMTLHGRPMTQPSRHHRTSVARWAAGSSAMPWRTVQQSQHEHAEDLREPQAWRTGRPIGPRESSRLPMNASSTPPVPMALDARQDAPAAHQPRPVRPRRRRIRRAPRRTKRDHIERRRDGEQADRPAQRARDPIVAQTTACVKPSRA